MKKRIIHDMIFNERAGDLVATEKQAVNRVIEETGVYFGDGSHIIYVNGSYKDDNDPVRKLLHDCRCISSVICFIQH